MKLVIDKRTNKVYKSCFNGAGEGFFYFESWDKGKSRLTDENGNCHFYEIKEIPTYIKLFKVIPTLNQ